MSNVNQLIWFRQDLRVRDHAALWHACQQGPSIGLVILSPEQWKIHHDAPIKINFYLRQLQQLKKELEKLNIPLIIQVIPYWKDIADYICELTHQLHIENVYSNIEVGVNELKRDKTVQQALNQQGKELFYFMTVRFFLYVLFATSHSNHIKFSAHLKSMLFETRYQWFASVLSNS